MWFDEEVHHSIRIGIGYSDHVRGILHAADAQERGWERIARLPRVAESHGAGSGCALGAPGVVAITEVDVDRDQSLAQLVAVSGLIDCGPGHRAGGPVAPPAPLVLRRAVENVLAAAQEGPDTDRPS